jgi:AAA family ATPase
MIARALAKQANAQFFTINGPDIISKYVGQSETNIRNVFEKAMKHAPSIIFIDEIDAICMKREDATDELQKRIVASFLTLMDGLISSSSDTSRTPASKFESLTSSHIDNEDLNNERDLRSANMVNKSRVLIIGATNRRNALDSALRRPGRFDREIEIGIPSNSDRARILNKILRKMPHSLSKEDVDEIASVTHGFVGADLQALCREAGLNCLHRSYQQSSALLARQGLNQINETCQLTQSISGYPGTESSTACVANSGKDITPSLIVTKSDMELATVFVRPSSMREIAVDVPNVKWSDIGGQVETKQLLREAVEWPLKNPQAFRRLGIRPPKGILLYGPPGCSKTLLAKAVATECSNNFIAVKGPELFSKYVGDSEKAVREVFRKARAAAPSVIFFDEIDALAVSRGGDSGGVVDRVLSQLLVEMDGIQPLKQVTVLAATNRPDLLDKALIRPGRIDRILFVGPPDFEAAKSILQIEMSKMAIDPQVLGQLDQLAVLAKGLSGAEITAACREAALSAMEESVDAEYVKLTHFKDALISAERRITKEMLQFYHDYRDGCGLFSV